MSATDTEWSNLFSVDEVLSGLPARRASMLLYAIEGRTGFLAVRSQGAMSPSLVPDSAEQREHAYLAAMRSGAELPFDPDPTDLERYAPNWAPLVPDDPAIRASLLKLMSGKYRLPWARTPAIQQAIGTATPEVEARYRELYGEPVSSAFAEELSVRERLSWARARLGERLENLPAFWMAFALTLTETVGAGILALPIAFAIIGPLGGVVVLLALGLVNVLTIAAMSESVARNGGIRFGHAFFGRLVQDYLGRPGMLILAPAVLLLNFVALLAFMLGFSSTVSEAIGLSPMVWVALHFVVMLSFVRKDSLNATVASALVVGCCSILLVIGMVLISLPHMTGTNLRYSGIPLMDGRPFDATALQLILGTTLSAYFGHTVIANGAGMVLSREPTGSALIRGSVTAMVVAIVLNAGWVFVVNGAIPHEQLADLRGTAITPLADAAGPAINIAGTIFVVLSIGMVSIHIAWSMKRSVAEWLPARSDADSPWSLSRSGVRSLLSRPIIRTAVSLSPVVLIFLVVEWLFATDSGSFSEFMSIVGVLTVPIISGVFAMLMLAAARRKGDCLVGYGWAFLGKPFVVGVLVVFFLVAIFAHGLVIWSDFLPRLLALAVGVALVVVIVLSLRSGEFERRAIIQVRFEGDPAGKPAVELVEAGAQGDGAVRFAGTGNESTQSLELEDLHIPLLQQPERAILDISMATTRASQLKVWVHELTPEGISRVIPARLTRNQQPPVDLEEYGGKVLLDIQEGVQAIRIDAERPS